MLKNSICFKYEIKENITSYHLIKYVATVSSKQINLKTNK